jgi:hypothetical protein
MPSFPRPAFLTTGLCLLGLFLVTSSSGLLAVDCYKTRDCQGIIYDPTNPNSDICVVVSREALFDAKADTNINTFKRGTIECGKKRRFNTARQVYEDMMTSNDPNDLLRGPVWCGFWRKGAECAGL